MAMMTTTSTQPTRSMRWTPAQMTLHTYATRPLQSTTCAALLTAEILWLLVLSSPAVLAVSAVNCVLCCCTCLGSCRLRHSMFLLQLSQR